MPGTLAAGTGLDWAPTAHAQGRRVLPLAWPTSQTPAWPVCPEHQGTPLDQAQDMSTTAPRPGARDPSEVGAALRAVLQGGLALTLPRVSEWGGRPHPSGPSPRLLLPPPRPAPCRPCPVPWPLAGFEVSLLLKKNRPKKKTKCSERPGLAVRSGA